MKHNKTFILESHACLIVTHYSCIINHILFIIISFSKMKIQQTRKETNTGKKEIDWKDDENNNFFYFLQLNRS